MTDLLPCPMCGTAAHFFKIDDVDQKDFGGQGICCHTEGCVQIGLMFACMDDPKPTLAEKWNRRAPTQGADARPVPWENLPCYLIDKCEGQVISEEFLQRATSEMLADPQYSGAKPFELSQKFISAAKYGPDVMGFDANAPAPPSVECPKCEGTGYDGSGYARVCPTCKGDATIATRDATPVVDERPVATSVIDHCWSMYQQGQISADHTAKEVFAEVLQSFAAWQAARATAEQSKPLTREQILDLCCEFGQDFINGHCTDVWGLLIHLYGLERALKSQQDAGSSRNEA